MQVLSPNDVGYVSEDDYSTVFIPYALWHHERDTRSWRTGLCSLALNLGSPCHVFCSLDHSRRKPDNEVLKDLPPPSSPLRALHFRNEPPCCEEAQSLRGDSIWYWFHVVSSKQWMNAINETATKCEGNDRWSFEQGNLCHMMDQHLVSVCLRWEVENWSGNLELLIFLGECWI